MVLLLLTGARVFACSDPTSNKINAKAGFAEAQEVYLGRYREGKFKILHAWKGKPSGAIEPKCTEDYREGLTYLIYGGPQGAKGVYLGNALTHLAVYERPPEERLKAMKIAEFLVRKQDACSVNELPDCGKCSFADSEPSAFCDECKRADLKYDDCLASTHTCLEIEDDTRAAKCDDLVRKATAKILKLKWLN